MHQRGAAWSKVLQRILQRAAMRCWPGVLAEWLLLEATAVSIIFAGRCPLGPSQAYRLSETVTVPNDVGKLRGAGTAGVQADRIVWQTRR